MTKNIVSAYMRRAARLNAKVTQQKEDIAALKLAVKILKKKDEISNAQIEVLLAIIEKHIMK